MAKEQMTPMMTQYLKTKEEYEDLSLIHIFGYRPGREIGDVLRKLIDEVIIDANLNNRDYLLKEARILKKSNSKNGSQR